MIRPCSYGALIFPAKEDGELIDSVVLYFDEESFSEYAKMYGKLDAPVRVPVGGLTNERNVI